MMRYSSRLAALAVALALTALGCSDGGSRGSGISTAEGNVANVETALAPRPARSTRIARFVHTLFESPAFAQTLLEGILVTVEGTAIHGTTDSSGRFSVRGRFEGDVSLRFETPQDGSATRVAVNVPAGGTMTFRDVVLDAPSGRATPASIGVAFEGRILAVDCPAATATLVSTQSEAVDTDAYTVRLAGSTLQDRRGRPLACDDLRPGVRVHLTGEVADDGSFGSVTLRELD